MPLQYCSGGDVLKPVLVIDCYVEGDGSKNFRRLLDERPITVWRPMDMMQPPDLDGVAAVMISGSAACVTDPVPWMGPLVEAIQSAQKRDIPILGICFGHQIVAHAIFGEGTVRKAQTPEIGWKDIVITGVDPLFGDELNNFSTFVSHFDEVRPEVQGMTTFAQTKDCSVHAYRVDGARTWGVQFHAEMEQREAEELSVIRIEGRPDLGLDVTETLSKSKDSSALARHLFRNFLSVR